MYFKINENGVKLILTLRILNYFQVNEKHTSNNLLNPQPEAEDHIFKCPLPLSE